MNLLNEKMIDLTQYMDHTETFDRVREKSDLATELKARIAARRNGFDGDALPWETTHSKIKFRKGELTIWAGVNGQGKSLMLGQMVLGFMREKKKALVVSLEMTGAATLDRMSSQFSGYEYPTEEMVDQFMNWRLDHLYIFDFIGMINKDKIVALCRYAKDIGCDHIIIDSLTKCTGDDEDSGEQKAITNALAEVSKEVGIHVHLVHHARKGNDELKIINKYDIKGSGVITDLADNVIIIARNKSKEYETAANGIADNTVADQYLIVSKQRHGNWEGTIELWFDRKTQTYTDSFNPIVRRYGEYK